jgi:PAS domain S-box-containing protein
MLKFYGLIGAFNQPQHEKIIIFTKNYSSLSPANQDIFVIFDQFITPAALCSSKHEIVRVNEALQSILPEKSTLENLLSDEIIHASFSAALKSPETFDCLYNELPDYSVKIKIKSLKDTDFVLLSFDFTEKKINPHLSYREIFDQANQVIYINNYDTLAFEDVNQKALEIFGKTKEEMLASDGSEYSSNNPGYTLQDAVEKLLKAKFEGPQVFDWQSKAADGSLFWTEVRIQKINMGGVDKIVTFFYSIDDRKKLEQELKRANEENKKILDSSLDIITTVDENGRFVKISAACEKVWGYTPEELIGKEYIDFVNPEDKHVSKQIEENIINGINENYFQNTYIRKDGSKVPMVWTSIWDENDKMFYAVARDATESQKAEKAIQESEERYRHLFNNNPFPMFIWDFETFEIVECNDEALKKYGYTKEEFIGKSIKDIRPEEDRQIFEKITVNEEEYNKPHKRVWRHLKKNGDIMYVEASGNTINYKGRTSAFVIINDVTEKVKTEQLLQESEQKLRNLNTQLEKKVASRTAELIETNRHLEAFSYSISHDLKSPIRTINVFSQILTKKLDHLIDDDTKELLTTIQSNCLRMSEMVEKMLDFSKTGKKNLQKEKIDTEALVRDVVANMDIHENPALQIIIHPMPTCKADQSMMKQLFANLISNAVKYSSRNPAPLIEIGAQQDERKTTFYVKDNGTGFDSKYASKLFQVFKRLHSDNEFDGTGVGLAIVKQIVEKHGGKVWAEGELGVGATFYFSIPNPS